MITDTAPIAMEEKHKDLHSNGRKTLQELRNCPLVGTGQREAWLVFVGFGWFWLVLVGYGWFWLVLVGFGWFWLALVSKIFSG